MEGLYPSNTHRNWRASPFLLSVQKAAAEHHTERLSLRRGKPTVLVNIRGASKEFIVDSESGVSLIQPGVYRSEVRFSTTTSLGVMGDALNISGEQNMQFSLNKWNHRHTFCACSLPTEADDILGMDFLPEMVASLDIEKPELRLRKHPMANRSSLSRRISGVHVQADHAALTVFST
jgi:hypothetical protein